MQTPEDKHRMKESEYAQCRRDKELLQTALQQAERERDAALTRAKELEAKLSKADEVVLELASAHRAVETALASARAAVGRVAEYVGYLEQDIAAARKNREPQTGMHVPYHGAFCSAPISTIKDLERFARSMRDLLTSHPAPVAAPCAELTRWSPCEVDTDDEDGSVFQGLGVKP